jgi:hypothetical protein
LVVRLLLLLLALGTAARAKAVEPFAVARAFCLADANGERLRPGTWKAVAPLITWGLEPAWDRVFLIDGYEVGQVRYDDATDPARAFVEVRYGIIGEVRGKTITKETREERRTLRLAREDESGRWRVVGPPPVPRVFVSKIDAEELAASLDFDAGSFLSDSAFVHRLLHDAGWTLPPLLTPDFGNTAALLSVTDPKSGDLVLYYDGDTPYHVGVLEDAGVVVSATLNGGVRRTAIDAFPGSVQYRRLFPEARAESTPNPTLRSPLP